MKAPRSSLLFLDSFFAVLPRPGSQPAALRPAARLCEIYYGPRSGRPGVKAAGAMGSVPRGGHRKTGEAGEEQGSGG